MGLTINDNEQEMIWGNWWLVQLCSCVFPLVYLIYSDLACRVDDYYIILLPTKCCFPVQLNRPFKENDHYLG